MARLFARREKGISWTRTVLPTNRQPITQINAARKARANQVRRNGVVVLVVGKIAQSHKMAMQVVNRPQRVLALVLQAK
jgi:DNA-binding IclR family transcriptional regulator